MSIDRRSWIASLAAAGFGATFAGRAGRAGAIGPIERSEGATMRLGLAAYSFNRQLRAPAGQKPTMTLEQFIDYSATLPLDAVELTSYYFPTTDRDYLVSLKGQCTRLGLDISGGAVGNDFCVADPEKLKEQIVAVNHWVEHASLLGCKTLRIFAGNVPKGESVESALPRCVKAIEEACRHAGRYGIYLALENHGGITAEADTMLEIVRAVESPWFGVNLDTGNFRTADPYGDLAKIAPYSVNVQVKTEIAPDGKKQDADLPRLIGILRDAGYRGYVVLEYEGPEEPREAVPRHVDELRKLLGRG